MKLNNNSNKNEVEELQSITNTLRYIAVFNLKYFSDIVMNHTKEALIYLLP